MTSYASRWTAILGWTVLMLIVWALFVPKGVSVGGFTLLCFTGPLLIVAGSMLLNAQKPSPSIRQMRATADADERAEPRTSA